MFALETLKLEANLFKALAHPVRLRILEALRQGELCVCHLSALSEKPQAYVSQQLAELRESGLVTDRKDGLRVFYRLNGEQIVDLLNAAKSYLGSKGELEGTSIGSSSSVPSKIPGCECPYCAGE